ncbi:hypothetical protein [Micromonospora sp. NPDC049679]|uniref:hypothetical protein n=1 Tax=Micromonospora sp. NPDC049679 TaxID=3155920 RepID=UPI0033FE7DB1
MTETNAVTARAVLGHGLALTPIGPDSLGLDLRWRDGTAGAGIAIVDGVENLAQDLTVALLTPTGTDPFDLGFGFDGLRVLTLNTPPALTEELIRLSVIRTLTADARVREVLDVTLSPVGADRRQRVTAEVRTVLGEALRLVLGEVEI